MKIGLISAYVIFLVINLIVNLVTTYLILAKKVDPQSKFVHVLTLVQTILLWVFGISLIRVAVSSGFKA